MYLCDQCARSRAHIIQHLHALVCRYQGLIILKENVFLRVRYCTFKNTFEAQYRRKSQDIEQLIILLFEYKLIVTYRLVEIVTTINFCVKS